MKGKKLLTPLFAFLAIKESSDQFISVYEASDDDGDDDNDNDDDDEYNVIGDGGDDGNGNCKSKVYDADTTTGKCSMTDAKDTRDEMRGDGETDLQVLAQY